MRDGFNDTMGAQEDEFNSNQKRFDFLDNDEEMKNDAYNYEDERQITSTHQANQQAENAFKFD